MAVDRSYGGLSTPQADVLALIEVVAGDLVVAADIDMDSNNLLNNTIASGGDDRSIITRTFNLTFGTMASKGAVTTHSFDWFTLAENEGIMWLWVENTGLIATGANVYINVGSVVDPDGLYSQTNFSAAGEYLDDNAKHGTDLGTFGVMGNSGNDHDATVYMGTGNAVKVALQTTAGNFGDLTAGGPWRVHAMCVRVDDTQMTEAV